MREFWNWQFCCCAVLIGGSNVNVVESFANFVKTKGKTVEYIQMISEKVNQQEIDFDNCREKA